LKETIYTTPVTEAFGECGEGDCPFCIMYNKLDENSIDFVMGPSYMEEDVRMETNKTGFCGSHMAAMYNRSNRLGLALMTHTHLMQLNHDLNALLKNLDYDAKKGLFKKGKKQTAPNETSDYLKKLKDSCYICDRTNKIFDRYIDTYFYLWGKNDDFIETAKHCGGFCLNHFFVLLETAEKKLSASDYADFLRITIPLQLNGLKTLEEDLDWFTKKFDYRNTNEPWRNSKDALIRGLKKISSVTVSD